LSFACRETLVTGSTANRKEYVCRILGAYRETPGTTGHVRREDRRLAGCLYDKGVPPEVVENALVLAAARRLLRPVDAPPLAAIRSLHYFLPVIDEVAALTVDQAYFNHLRTKTASFINNPKGG
jgi:hypothetical protein